MALEARAEADLALGHHVAAASELEGLVTRYPFRESLWGSYLLALYRSGRQVEALRAYQACRRVLVEELGIGPGHALRGLEAAILAQDPALDWRGPFPDRPRIVPSPVPPPPVARPGDDVSVMVGRSSELERLRTAWRDASAGRGGCVLVSGEAGIGKTRLVQEVAAAAAGADVVWGRCQEGEDAPAFWPWSQVVSALLAMRSPEAVADALRPSGFRPTDLAPLALPRVDGNDELPVRDPGAARFRLSQSVTTLVTALAAERPILVILDDVHWADVATLQLFRFLAPEILAARVLLVATYREEEVADDHPLVEALAAVARHSTTDRLRLAGLTRDEVTELVKATAGVADRAVVESVYRRTNGNPFFIGELVRLLEARCALDDPAVAAGAEVPAAIRDVIRLRLARLPEATNALLAIAAVAGQEFDVTVVGAVAGLAGDAILDALEPARLTG